MAKAKKKGRKKSGKKARKRGSKRRRRSSVKHARPVSLHGVFTRKVSKKRLPPLTKCVKNGPVDGSKRRVYVVKPLTGKSLERAERALANKTRRALEERAKTAARQAAKGRKGWEAIGAAAAARSAVLGYQ